MDSSPKKPIRLLIADDHPIVLSGTKNSLARTRKIQVVGEIFDGRQVVSAVKELTPDIVLLDLAVPGTSGIQITRKLAR